MKTKLLPLFLMLLLVSCTVTKRRYMHGYSVQWRQRASKTDAASRPNITDIAAFQPKGNTPIISYIENNNLSHSAPVEEPQIDNVSPYAARQGSADIKNSKAIPNALNQLPETRMEYLNFTSNSIAKTITGEGDTENDEAEDGKAKTSLTLGILSVAALVACILFLISVVLWAASIGTISILSGGLGSFLAGIFLLFIPFLFFGIAAIILGIIAEIYGIMALNKIRKFPDQYTGKSKAIIGIVLGSIIILLILFLVLFHIV